MLCSRFLLSRRLRLPRDDRVGDEGISSAARFTPPVIVVVWTVSDWGEVFVTTAWPFPAPLDSFFSTQTSAAVGVLGGVGTSCTGDGIGGGILVPSVREPNLKSNAGNWKRLVVVVEAGMEGDW